jgi:glycerophosphoryl diester phosphodiesterase
MLLFSRDRFAKSFVKLCRRASMSDISVLRKWKSHVEVQGHRGQRGLVVENILPSFISALEGGVDAVELDLHLTKDQHVIIYHDYHISNKLCMYEDGREIIEPLLLKSLTLSEIKSFSCGSIKSNEFPRQSLQPGCSIPTLKELFDAVGQHPLGKTLKFNLEIKRDTDNPENSFPPEFLAQRVIEVVKLYNMDDRVAYSSFDFEVLDHVRRIDGNCQIGVLQEAPLSFIELVDKAHRLSAQIVSPPFEVLRSIDDVKLLQGLTTVDGNTMVTPSMSPVKEPLSSAPQDATVTGRIAIKRRRVVVWTANDEAAWKHLIHIGVDGIITDYPNDLIAYLNRNSLPLSA